MIDERHETIADIVADMRQDIADGTVGIWSDFGGEIARCYADRIEAAAKESARLDAKRKARKERKVEKRRAKQLALDAQHDSRKRCGRRR